MMEKIQSIYSMEKSEQTTPEHFLSAAREQFSDKAAVYAVMDHTVALGVFENGSLKLCLQDGSIHTEFTWEYVREIRIFNEEKELRLRRLGECFYQRLRDDRPDSSPQTKEIHYRDEVQKLWGTVQPEQTDRGFLLLSSARGTKIRVPEGFFMKAKEAGEIGLTVRKYMHFPDLFGEDGGQDISDKTGLVRPVDERFVGLCRWTGLEVDSCFDKKCADRCADGRAE